MLLWLLELARLLSGLEPLRHPAMLLLAIYMILVFPDLRPGTRRAALALIGAACALGWASGGLGSVLEGLAFATVFPAFMATMVLMRVAARAHPEVEVARGRVAALGSGARQAGFMLASHLLATVVTAGAFAIMGPLRPDRLGEPDRRRLALASLRGANLAVLWSPFFLGMAVVTQLVPGVPVWQVTICGLLLSTLALVLAITPLGRHGPASIALAAHALMPIMPPVAVAAALIVAVSSLLGTSPLAAVFLVVPPLLAAWLWLQPAGTPGRVARESWDGLAKLGDEMMLVVSVSILARVLAGAPWTADLAATVIGLGLPPTALLGVLLLLILALALLGLHPIASVSVVLTLMAGPGGALEPLPLIVLGLLGWALGTMVGPTSLSVLIASSSFDVSPRHLVLGVNLVFVSLLGLLSVLLLGGLNAWLAA